VPSRATKTAKERKRGGFNARAEGAIQGKLVSTRGSRWRLISAAQGARRRPPDPEGQREKAGRSGVEERTGELWRLLLGHGGREL
jgi:hypothetical protein